MPADGNGNRGSCGCGCGGGGSIVGVNGGSGSNVGGNDSSNVGGDSLVAAAAVMVTASSTGNGDGAADIIVDLFIRGSAVPHVHVCPHFGELLQLFGGEPGLGPIVYLHV